MPDYPSSYIIKCNATEEFKNKNPSLEELFLAFKNISKNKNKNDLKVISCLRIAMAQACCTSFLEKQSVWDLFLIAYMYEKHKKEWHSSKSQWI